MATADACLLLSRRWGTQGWRGRLAGILHDCAREMSGKRLVGLVGRTRRLSRFERRHSIVLHGEAAALIAAAEYGVRDRQVLQAVADHVVGRPGMPLLSRQLYVADMVAADRQFPAAEHLRKLAARLSPENMFRKAAELKMSYLREQGLCSHPSSERLAVELGLAGMAERERSVSGADQQDEE
jgi:predicted HD superfamily hydrolase involved in NAD metabolism